MTRLRGRAPKGKRLVCHAPHGHWRTTTMISSVRLNGQTACMIKALLRKAEARNHPDLLAAVASALRSVPPQDALGWFAHCGYNFI